MLGVSGRYALSERAKKQDDEGSRAGKGGAAESQHFLKLEPAPDMHALAVETYVYLRLYGVSQNGESESDACIRGVTCIQLFAIDREQRAVSASRFQTVISCDMINSAKPFRATGSGSTARERYRRATTSQSRP